MLVRPESIAGIPERKPWREAGLCALTG